MTKGWPYTHTLWSQEYHSPNLDPNIVELTMPHPITAEIYYSTCGKIDRHDRFCQESLDIEKNWLLEIGRSGSIYMIFK